MKKILLFFTLLIFGITFGQNYSNNKIENYISKLIELSVNLDDYDYDVSVSEPIGRKETFIVKDKYTSNFISSKKWFADNEQHLIFIKIYRKGTESDFLIMTNSEYPNIRVYGFWALIKNNKINDALNVLKEEKGKAKEIEWNSLGCDIYLKQTDELMSEIFEIENIIRANKRQK